MMASPHFSVSEFTFSETASRHGIDNSCPDDNILDNILITANYMESVRELLNHKPIFISSGYRCLALNEFLTLKDWLQTLLAVSLELLTKLYSLLLIPILIMTNLFWNMTNGCISLFAKMKKYLADKH